MEDQKVQPLNSALWAAALALNFFWVLNILKEAFSSTKNFLNFYPSVGPLLGLFVFSVVLFSQDSYKVRKLVSLVSKIKESNPRLPLTALSGGTEMSGGAINDSITI